MLRKNEIYPVTFAGYSAEGLGVCRIDGQVVFVAGALDGERAEVRIVKVLKQLAYGRIERLLEASPHRIVSDCPYFVQCGGCSMRHMDYAEELRFKQGRIRDALTRIGGVDPGELPVLGAEETDGYRNKALFPVGEADGVPIAGFYRARSHDVVPVERCRLQAAHADAAKNAILTWMRENRVSVYDETQNKGLVRHLYVRSAFGTGQVLVCVVVNGKKLPNEDGLVDAIRKAVPEVNSIVLAVNREQTNAVLGAEYRTLWGADVIEDTLCGLNFRLSPRSFYQVNRKQAQRLYAIAREKAALTKNDTAIDLYCGTGTISLVLAKDAGEVIGVEVIPAAIEDAKENAARNGVENARFFCADAGEAAARLAREGIRPTAVVVDPPRKGLSEDVIEAIAVMSPDRVVYVSCDPGTLARDIKLLTEKGYALKSAEGVDLFPRTPHVESVVLLQQRSLPDGK
ncbi:MAG: 23S rRNA (uracil(1939)-C(5))-methyltransferase RlmD [Oscillospiraceae bacterium]|nr:23S rRNA (uracil(1939)-C(5))-methyltransferase RlmD [Oscillospiraceae bacterium]